MDRLAKHFRLVLLLSALTNVATSETLGTRDTFSAAKLTKQEITQLVPILEQLAYDIPDSWETELRAKRVDLGDSQGLVLQGTSLLCGGTGNCQVFIFRRMNGRWVSLFQRQGPICETFTFGPGTTKGIKNLTVESNQSTDATHRVVYRFDGQFYQNK